MSSGQQPCRQKALPGAQKAGLTGQDKAPPAAKAKPAVKRNFPVYCLPAS